MDLLQRLSAVVNANKNISNAKNTPTSFFGNAFNANSLSKYNLS